MGVSPGRTAALLCAVAVGGCVSTASVHRAEIDALSVSPSELRAYYHIDSFDGLMRYGTELADNYVALADRAAAVQDLAALGVIAAAATAVGAVAYGAHADVVAGAGLAAGTIVAVSGYLRPAEAASALLNAAEQTVCIVRSGRKTEALHDAYVDSQSFDAQRIAIVTDGISSVRVSLRRLMKRQMPDYAKLVADLTAAMQTAPPPGSASLAADAGDRTAALEASVAELRADVAKCLLIAP
jgi:hypothetical protein